MFCPKCGSENREGVAFCTTCGQKLSENNERQQATAVFENDEKTMKFENNNQNTAGFENPQFSFGKQNPQKGFNSDSFKFFKSKRNIVIVCSVLVLLIGGITAFLYFNNPVNKFESDIKNNKSAEAVKLYSEKIKGNSDKVNKVTAFLKKDAADIAASFKDEKIDFNKAKESLETIKAIGMVSDDVNSSLNKINSLNDSRVAFKKAEEFLKNSDYVNAIIEYKKVISDDKNYDKAKEQIATNEKKYKDQVVKNADEAAGKQDYAKAIAAISDALAVLPNDADLKAKNETYKKLQQDKLEAERKQKIEDAKNKQELMVVSASVVPDYFSIDDEAKVIVKNNSNKVVKTYTVGILMFDANGYPLKSGVLAGETQLFKGKADSVNIQGGQTSGEEYAWNLYTNYGTVKTIMACVIDVEYYDGSKWTNDYYNYWKDQQGKPYKQ